MNNIDDENHILKTQFYMTNVVLFCVSLYFAIFFVIDNHSSNAWTESIWNILHMSIFLFVINIIFEVSCPSFEEIGIEDSRLYIRRKHLILRSKIEIIEMEISMIKRIRILPMGKGHSMMDMSLKDGGFHSTYIYETEDVKRFLKGMVKKIPNSNEIVLKRLFVYRRGFHKYHKWTKVRLINI